MSGRINEWEGMSGRWMSGRMDVWKMDEWKDK